MGPDEDVVHRYTGQQPAVPKQLELPPACQCRGCCADHESGPCDDPPFAVFGLLEEAVKTVCLACLIEIAKKCAGLS